MLVYVFWSILFYVTLVGEHAPRYMAGLAIAAPFLIGKAFSLFNNKKERLTLIIVASTMIIFNVITVINRPPVLCLERYAKLAGWLSASNALRGYSDYDTAYITQFESREKAGISPTLFHPTFCDRFPEETKMVRNSDDLCYIIDGAHYPHAAGSFEKSLDRLGLRYDKDMIGDFTIYRGIPREFEPKDMIRQMSKRGA
jgi:hypothetical protein